MSIGVPIKVLHEAEGHIVTCETNTGEVYRGKLIEAEDNMNCQVSCFARETGESSCLCSGKQKDGDWRFLKFLLNSYLSNA